MKTTKRFCRDLRQHKTEITDCHKKEMLKPKKKKEKKAHHKQQFCHISTRNLMMNLLTMKIMARFDITVITQEIIEGPHVISVI